MSYSLSMTHIQRETLSLSDSSLTAIISDSAIDGKTADRKDKEDRERKEREDERERKEREREERERKEYEEDQESQSLLYLGNSSLKKMK